VGYSISWEREPTPEELLAKKPKKPEEPEVPGELVAKKPPEEVAPGEIPPEEEVGKPPPEEMVPPEPKVATIFPEPIETKTPMELPPGKVERDLAGRVKVARIDFMVDAPKPLSEDQPAEYLDTDTDPAMTDAAKQDLRVRKDRILQKLRETKGGLLIVGFSDKCYDGPPYMGTKYNHDLSLRRVKVVLHFIRRIMGTELEGVPIRIRPMGRRCANPLCRCDTPEMTACAKDRRVEIYVETGAEERFQCPEGDYWLVP
jgi:hypothetical protein